MVSRTTSLLDSLHTTKTVASYSTATEILCERAEPEFRCRIGPCVRTLDRPIEGQAQHLDSERFRVGPRTSQSLRARLTVRETRRVGWGQTHVSHETARVHHATWRRGRGVAARGGRAAAGPHPKNWSSVACRKRGGRRAIVHGPS